MKTHLALDVSRETRDRIDHFAALFQKWAKAINLVAPSTLNDLWQRHILDSAQLHALRPGGDTWIDLGSGGGFPGIVTAILLTDLNQGWVHLVESNHKKASFLRTAIRETGARATVHVERIEAASEKISSCDVLSARALAELDKLLDYSAPWMIGTKTTALFHKGRDYLVEVEKARGRWAFDLVEHPSVVEPDSMILEISGLQRLTATGRV